MNNIRLQNDDPTSMLNLYRGLATLRRSEPALSVGDYQSVDTGIEEVFAFRRFGVDSDDFLVLLNFGQQTHPLNLTTEAPQATIEISTTMTRVGEIDLENFILQPDEGIVLRVQ